LQLLEDSSSKHENSQIFSSEKATGGKNEWDFKEVSIKRDSQESKGLGNRLCVDLQVIKR